jgi:hypothetical protein
MNSIPLCDLMDEARPAAWEEQLRRSVVMLT